VYRNLVELELGVALDHGGVVKVLVGLDGEGSCGHLISYDGPGQAAAVDPHLRGADRLSWVVQFAPTDLECLPNGALDAIQGPVKGANVLILHGDPLQEHELTLDSIRSGHRGGVDRVDGHPVGDSAHLSLVRGVGRLAGAVEGLPKAPSEGVGE
jgi:hypothetical protein